MPISDSASLSVAGWSSPVARQAHNLKVVGSNPTPATNYYVVIQRLNKALGFSTEGFFAFFGLFTLTFTLTFIPMLVRLF